jgi:hypothetical protein
MSTFSTAFLSHDTYLVTIASFYNAWLVTMDTILIYHVTDVYQIHVIVSMVSVRYVSWDKNAVENVDIGLQGISIYININKYINLYKASVASN